MAAATPDITDIQAAITARLHQLAPLVDEHDRLEQADQALAAITNGKPTADFDLEAALLEPDERSAPYGYKADGTPRRSNGGRKAKATA